MHDSSPARPNVLTMQQWWNLPTRVKQTLAYHEDKHVAELMRTGDLIDVESPLVRRLKGLSL